MHNKVNRREGGSGAGRGDEQRGGWGGDEKKGRREGVGWRGRRGREGWSGHLSNPQDGRIYSTKLFTLQHDQSNPLSNATQSKPPIVEVVKKPNNNKHQQLPAEPKKVLKQPTVSQRCVDSPGTLCTFWCDQPSHNRSRPQNSPIKAT